MPDFLNPRKADDLPFTLIWSTSHLLAETHFGAISREDFFLAGKTGNLLILSRTFILSHLSCKKEKEQNLLAG